MNILGLSTFNDASAAIVSGGHVLCAVEEERLNRKKHYCGMPWRAIAECLDIAGMTPDDIDLVAIGWDVRRGWYTRIGTTIASFLRNPRAWRGKASRGSDYIHGCKEIITFKTTFPIHFTGSTYRGKVVYVPHHHAHAASAYLASGYDNADIIVADGIGESACVSMFRGSGNNITRIAEIPFPHSLGHVYAAVTGFLGFQMNCDEGKVMALASYGEDSYHAVMEDVIRIDSARKRIHVQSALLDYHAAQKNIFSAEWENRTGLKARKKNEPVTAEHANLACSLQKRVESAALYLIKEHFPDSQSRPLCAAGGFFLNSVLNGKIMAAHTPDLFVQPASGDNGVSVGAALHTSALRDAQYKRIPWIHASRGRNYAEDDIVSVLGKWNIPHRKSAHIFAETAELIKRGHVIAWFRGRMEFGPRALGNRSILADPSHPDMKAIINDKIKHRESFRPFAASILHDETSRYFINAGPSPFMLKVFTFREHCREKFPAICHVDGTCRLQTVTSAGSPDLYSLLQQMKRITGYGMLLNTSLNVAGEPIVNTLDEALTLFQNSSVDILVLEDYIIRKSDLPANPYQNIRS